MGEMAILVRKKQQKLAALEWQKTDRPKFSFKKIALAFGVVLVLSLVIYLITGSQVIQNNNWQIPIWLLIILFAIGFYFILYFIWKGKNWIVEWLLSTLYGVLIMLVIISIGREEIFGSIVNDWVRTLLGSLMIGSGGIALGFGVKLLLKPAFWVLKRTFLWEA